MRLFALSDLHLEKRSLSDVPRPSQDYDMLVCAGDVWEGEPGRGLEALAQLAAGRPVLIVPGNHDRYRRGPEDVRGAARMVELLRAQAARLSAEGSGPITVLDGGERATIAGITFIGATLWTDWTLAGHWRPDADPAEAVLEAILSVTDAETGSREYRGAILGEGGRVWQPHDAYRQHRRDREALRQALSEPPAGPVVAVTHHAPFTELLVPYRDKPGVPWWIPAFYGSTVLADLPEELRPDLWISGHFHAGHDVRIGGTRCLANPVAGADYDPERIVDI